MLVFCGLPVFLSTPDSGLCLFHTVTHCPLCYLWLRENPREFSKYVPVTFIMIRSLDSMLHKSCKLLTSSIFYYTHIQWLQLYGLYKKTSRNEAKFISKKKKELIVVIVISRLQIQETAIQTLLRVSRRTIVSSYYLKHQTFPTLILGYLKAPSCRILMWL